VKLRSTMPRCILPITKWHPRKSRLHHFEKYRFVVFPFNSRPIVLRRTGCSQDQVPPMLELILAPACLQFYKSIPNLMYKVQVRPSYIRKNLTHSTPSYYSLIYGLTWSFFSLICQSRVPLILNVS